jgi:hypothetical protein
MGFSHEADASRAGTARQTRYAAGMCGPEGPVAQSDYSRGQLLGRGGQIPALARYLRAARSENKAPRIGHSRGN